MAERSVLKSAETTEALLADHWADERAAWKVEKMAELKAGLKAVSWVEMWALWTVGQRAGPRAA